MIVIIYGVTYLFIYLLNVPFDSKVILDLSFTACNSCLAMNEVFLTGSW